MIIKKIIGAGAIAILFSVVVAIFWFEQFQFYRPVSLPENFQEVNVNDTIVLNNLLFNTKEKETRSVFIHFFDTSCKFSRINIEHIRLFTKKYKKSFSFYVVVSGEHDQNFIDTFKTKFQVPEFVRLISDKSCTVAKECGVYSTPQAVIINPNHTLYFRGNYNSQTGLCTPANIGNSSPAIAIRYKINDSPSPNFPPYMVQPWGCELFNSN